MMERRARFVKVIRNLFWWLVLTLGTHQTTKAERCEVDYIVVGSGSAGSVVANRLSANPENTVLLLEAGERPNLLSEIPNLYFYMQATKYDWNDTIEMPSFPEYDIKSKSLRLPQGKILGGTSAINGMIYTRGNKLDYDDWVKKGAVGWDWENVFRLFKKSENNQDISNRFHGNSGEMFVQNPSFRTPMAAKYLEAAEELGYDVGDVNGEEQNVFMNPQLTVHNGKRWGSTMAFIDRIEGRPNFFVKTSALVRKVLFEGNRSCGVEYDYKGERKITYAKKEVILSAGAIKTPQILMLSGIGPKEELKKYGISVISDLPVGKNFNDHVVVNVYSKIINKHNISGFSISEKDYNEFLLSGKGILADISTEAIGFAYSRVGIKKQKWPNIEILFSTLIQPKTFAFRNKPVPTSSCIAILLRPKSRGELTLKSKDPYDQPNINPNYLSNEDDVKVIVEGIKKCQAFENTKAMKNILGATAQNSVCQNYTIDSYDYLACFAKSQLLPGYHMSGSCKMGSPKDPWSVVDPDLRVIGVEGLRVADCSIMPTPASGHTHAIAVMIGEKAAESILKESSSTKSYINQLNS